MVKEELVANVSEVTNNKPKDVKKITEAIFSEIENAIIDGEKVTIANFGTFQSKEKARKKGTNPSTGEPLWIEAKTVPYFKPGKRFKESVMNGVK